MIKAENKTLLSAIIIGFAVLILALVFLLKPVQDSYGANRVDLTSCVASSTFFTLAADTLTRIAATNTSRMSFIAEATSTPGSTIIIRPGYGLPNPTGPQLGRTIQTASSSVLVQESDLEIGPVWAFSQSSVAKIMVQECSFAI